MLNSSVCENKKELIYSYLQEKRYRVKTDYMLLVAFYTAPNQRVDPPVISY